MRCSGKSLRSKTSYTIAWKQSIPGCMSRAIQICDLLTATVVELNESVEYKSLPSGLHNVQEDLMYAVYTILATIG